MREGPVAGARFGFPQPMVGLLCQLCEGDVASHFKFLKLSRRENMLPQGSKDDHEGRADVAHSL